jgi:serine/threonine protein kinase
MWDVRRNLGPPGEQLDHPHICALYYVGDQGGTAYLVMQYLEGETLADRLAKGALPIDQALQIAIQTADALVAAHRAGIVHRDLNPGNIMLSKDGREAPRLRRSREIVSVTIRNRYHLYVC